MATLNSNLGVKNILRPPKDVSRTPGGTRTPGWEPLLYGASEHIYEIRQE